MISIPQYNFFKTKYGDELLIDVVELNSIRKYMNETPVHSLTYYDITIITAGDGFFAVDGQTYGVKPGDVIFSRPGEIRTWDKENIDNGYALIFEEEFVLSFFSDPGFMQEMLYFRMERITPILSLGNEMNTRITSLIISIKQEICTYPTKDKHLLRALLYEVLTLLNRAYKEANPVLEKKQKTKQVYVKQFADLVNSNFKENRSIQYYADKLCITPNHLNDVINQAMGINSKRYILNRTLLEAKKMLSYLDLSVTEIAEELNFDNTSYFIRFFRKQTGQTPLQYRNKAK